MFKYNVGDIVNHMLFGDGTVLKSFEPETGNSYEVAFPNGNGVVEEDELETVIQQRS